MKWLATVLFLTRISIELLKEDLYIIDRKWTKASRPNASWNPWQHLMTVFCSSIAPRIRTLRDVTLRYGRRREYDRNSRGRSERRRIVQSDQLTVRTIYLPWRSTGRDIRRREINSPRRLLEEHTYLIALSVFFVSGLRHGNRPLGVARSRTPSPAFGGLFIELACIGLPWSGGQLIRIPLYSGSVGRIFRTDKK